MGTPEFGHRGQGEPVNGPRFKLADGSPSAYGFACGHVQRIELAHGAAEIYREHNCYHVRRFDYRARDNGALLSTWRVWDSFDVGNLSGARRRFRQFARTLRQDSK
jgi:hypothetical protein